jgi:hypothetical protein
MWPTTLGIKKPDNFLWLAEVGGVECIFKRAKTTRRNPKVQLFVDELKPIFDLPKMGCSLGRLAGFDRMAVFVKKHGRGTNLAMTGEDSWIFNPDVIVQISRVLLLDVFTAKKYREKRNMIWLPDGTMMPVDEEKSLDFDLMPQFNMSDRVRKMMIVLGSQINMPEYCDIVADRITDKWDWITDLAKRCFGPGVGMQCMERLTERRSSAKLHELWLHYVTGDTRLHGDRNVPACYPWSDVTGDEYIWREKHDRQYWQVVMGENPSPEYQRYYYRSDPGPTKPPKSHAVIKARG